jgi:hypothetical protein
MLERVMRRGDYDSTMCNIQQGESVVHSVHPSLETDLIPATNMKL